MSDSAFDKSTDDRSHHVNLFDYSTISDVNTHMSDFDKTTDNDSDKTNHNIKLSDINLFQNCDLTPSNVKDLQAKDNDLKAIIKYLRDRTLPSSQRESRKLLLEAADYILVDGILFHSNLSKSNRRKTKHHQHYQLVVPRLMIKHVLQICHDSPMGGHSGIQNTIHIELGNFIFSKDYRQ